MRFSATVLLCLATLAATPIVLAQDHETVPDPEEFNTPIPLYTVALGDHTYPISTRNADAQARKRAADQRHASAEQRLAALRKDMELEIQLKPPFAAILIVKSKLHTT